MRRGYSRGLVGIVALLMSAIACRPVVTIGWSEIMILFVVVAVILGPLLFRLYRALAGFREYRDSIERKKEERRKRGQGD